MPEPAKIVAAEVVAAEVVAAEVEQPFADEVKQSQVESTGDKQSEEPEEVFTIKDI